MRRFVEHNGADRDQRRHGGEECAGGAEPFDRLDPQPMAREAGGEPGNVDPEIERDHAGQHHRRGESVRAERGDVGLCQLRGHERPAHRAGHRQAAALDDMHRPADQIVVVHRTVSLVQHDEPRRSRAMLGFSTGAIAPE